MGFLVLLAIIVFLVGFLVITIAIGNLKHRARQHFLKDTGVSTAEISAGLAQNFVKKHLQKFLQEHSNYTEESIKDLLNQYTIQLMNRNTINEFSETVCQKMQTDSKLDKMQKMEFKRVLITYYGSPRLNATVVYTDNKDEYNVYLTCNIVDDKIQVEKYQIAKGSVVGF